MRGYLSKGLDEMRGKGISTRRNNKYKGKGELVCSRRSREARVAGRE